MKLKTIAAAAVLSVVGIAANAASYDFSGTSLPVGFSFTEASSFAGGGFALGEGLGSVTSYKLYSFSDLVNPLQTAYKTGSVFTLDSKTFAAGTYFLSVTGKGQFTGHYSTTPIAAVPEPETYALMLGGLGVVGFIARRRKVS